MADHPVSVAELRDFIERFEALDVQRQKAVEQQKELMAEARGRGYDTRAMRRLVAERRRRADEVAEQEAVLECYRAALCRAEDAP